MLSTIPAMLSILDICEGPGSTSLVIKRKKPSQLWKREFWGNYLIIETCWSDITLNFDVKGLG